MRIFGLASITAAVAIVLLVLSAPPAGAATISTGSDAGAPLHATIKRDQHGIPNIIGSDFADVGFGFMQLSPP